MEPGIYWPRIFPGDGSAACEISNTARPAACRHGTRIAASRANMKRVLRNIQSAMFIKFDGGETDSFQSARLFLSYDEAVAFCMAHNLADVELVVRTDGESEYTVPVPTEYVIAGEDDGATEIYVPDNGSPAEPSAEPMPHSLLQAFEQPCACDRDIGVAVQVHVSERGTEGRPAVDDDEGDTLCILMDETEAAISEYADFEQAAQAPEFHFSPPEKCDSCGVDLRERWFFVDGRVRGSGEWRDMCSQCFFATGARIGRGKGQLYQRQADGRWLLVGGFPS